MSRREEVEKKEILEDVFRKIRELSVNDDWQIGPTPEAVSKQRFNVGDDMRFDEYIFDGERQLHLDEVCDLLNAAYPTRYTPREEVTEGLWSAKWSTGYERRIPAFKVIKVESGELFTDVRDGLIWPLDRFTDFLPVPAWLVDGIGEQPK